MRKLFVVAAAALGIFMLAPVSSASADTFTGVCTASGTADFPSPGLKTAPNPNLEYTFNTDGTGVAPNQCTGKLNGNKVINTPLSATATNTNVEPDGSDATFLSCAASVSTGGEGSLTFTFDPTITTDDVTIDFGISLVATATEVNFVLTGNASGYATGHATFARNLDQAPECGAPNGVDGITALGFDIAAAAVTLAD